jgi:tetratricopeptide (TPR) repeat protein
MSSESLASSFETIRQLVAEGKVDAAALPCAIPTQSMATDPSVWSRLAQIALRANKLLEAQEFMLQAVMCAPDDTSLLLRYGQILLRLGRRKQALDVAERAEGLSIGQPQIRDALGTLFTHLEDPARAIPYFRRAVEDEPTNIDFRYNLAMAQRMVGDFNSAEANLDVVISARPLDGEAYHTRSHLRNQTLERNHVPQLASALRRLTGQRASLPVAFALAKELDDLGEFSQSFAHLHAACRSYRASLRYDVADDIAVLEKLRSKHTRPVLDSLRTTFDSEEPIFIVGLPRSGTTLVERILGMHSDVVTAGELEAFPSVIIEAVSRLTNTAVKKLDFVDNALRIDLTDVGPRYLEATRPRTGKTPKFTDKLPLNYLYAGLIHAALPRARFIAMHRHPLDSCYAMYKTLFANAYPFTYDLGDLGRYYIEWTRLMRHWEEVIEGAWLSVSYEELVSNQETVSRQILDHCGLAWDERCLRFYKLTAAVTTASAVQVRKPMYSESIGKSRRYARELQPLVSVFEANGIAIN